MTTNRTTKMKQWLQENEIDVLLCQTRANVYYLTGFDTDPHERLVATFIFQDAKPFIICPNMEVNQVKELYQDGEIIGYSDTEDPFEKIKDACEVRKVTVKKAAVENSISWERMKRIQNSFPGLELIEADEPILSQRIVKTEEEIAILREAAKLADFGVEIGVKTLSEGITETEVVAKIEYELKKKGVREMSFSTMVLFGEKGGDPHGKPGNRKLKKGDSVLFDLGVIWKGYCSDITRTVFFDHVTKRDQEVYEIVLLAQNAALEKCKKDNSISLLDRAARDIISENGFGEYFPHRIGHGLGIEVHEYPSLNETNSNTLQVGMTFTIEPGIYISNELGVRIEDDVLITETGFETLTKFPKELTIIS
ncbi:M24 family metallopeptidase [Evansella sp. AB-rgal1]|uniref:M24 family metallopeptidase n=1 Tax=Evansella sp. AB-rgal1 TaxID=3242696 RepID=UPI00359E7461